jgi:hypothetical protein
MKGKTRDLRKVAMTATAVVVAAAIATRSSSRHSWHHGSYDLSFLLAKFKPANSSNRSKTFHEVVPKKNELIVHNNTLGEHFLKMWDQLKTIIIIVFLPFQAEASRANKAKQS